MKKDFNSGLGVASSVVFKNETMSGINFNVDAQNTSNTIASAIDLNKISIDITLTREGHKPVAMFKGYLLDLLTALYAQTPMFDVAITPRGTKYNFPIDFGNILVLRGDDELKVDFNIDTASFISISKTNSAVFFESIAGYGVQGMMPIVTFKPYGNSEVNFDWKFEGAISKLVLVTDLTATYEASSKAKLSSANITADNYESNLSEDTIYAENLQMLANEAGNDVKNLVLYDGDLLTSMKLVAKLTAAADASTKVLALQWGIF